MAPLEIGVARLATYKGLEEAQRGRLRAERSPARSGGDTRRACAGSGSGAWSRRPWWRRRAGCPPSFCRLGLRSPCRRPAGAAPSGRPRARIRRAVSKAEPGGAGRTRSRGRARREDMVREAPRVGVLLAHASPRLVHQETVKDVGGFVDGGGNRLCGERRIPVGHMRVCLDSWVDPVLGVHQVHGFAPAAAGKNWPSLEAARPGPQKVAIGALLQSSSGLVNSLRWMG